MAEESQATNLTIGDEDCDLDEDEMDIVYVSDKGGNSKKMQMFEGTYYAPMYKPGVLKQIKTVKLRPDDVFFPSFPRTGTHWTFEMIGMLLNRKAETIPVFKGKHQLEFETCDVLSDLPSPRVINTHMKLSDAPAELTEANCKIVYNIRDPKDVAVSLYNAYLEGQHTCYTGSFEDFLPLFLEGKVDCNGLFEHWRDADTFFAAHPNIPVHIQVYEEALKDPVGTVQKLSDFLELDRNDDLCREIAEKCHFSNMKVDKDKFSMNFGSKNIHYRKGVSGDYRNYFNDHMLDDYYKTYEERLSGTRFYRQYLFNTL